MRSSTALVAVAGTALALLGLASGLAAHEPHECPKKYPDAPAVAGHIEQVDIVGGGLSLAAIREAGRELFAAVFNTCDGQGRPATTGGGDKRVADQPAFIRTSAPDSSACAGCHAQPRAGGGGDFVANVLVLAQVLDPVTESVSSEFSNERNTLGMFGSGPIEMLAREMTADLQSQAAALPDGTHTLVTKGVGFDVTIAAGEVVASRGVDTDLIVKPFHQAGVVRSVREFTVNAFNHHHGMQAEERFDLNPEKGFDSDFDEDGVERELTIGDVTAAALFQAALATPSRVLPDDPRELRDVEQGEALFSSTGCTACHVPAMTLDSRHFVEPNPLNPPGTFSDSSQSFAFDMTAEGEAPRLEAAPGGAAVVRAYTDLKRHNLCDDPAHPEPIRFYCNEELAQGRADQDGRPGSEFFLTRKLWDVGNSAPYGHRGDLTTVTDAILAHGGEARSSRDAFDRLPTKKQAKLVKFLKTLQVAP